MFVVEVVGGLNIPFVEPDWTIYDPDSNAWEQHLKEREQERRFRVRRRYSFYQITYDGQEFVKRGRQDCLQFLSEVIGEFRAEKVMEVMDQCRESGVKFTAIPNKVMA